MYNNIIQICVQITVMCLDENKHILQKKDIDVWSYSQVLLLDQQRGEVPKMPANPDAEERSFLFLLHPPSQFNSAKGSGTPLRVALRSLITCLTANQLILQIIGKVLLQGTDFSIPGLANVLLDADSANAKKLGKPLNGFVLMCFKMLPVGL